MRELMFPAGHGRKDRKARTRSKLGEYTKELVDIEMAAHGGTIIEIAKTDGKWPPVLDGKYQPAHHRRDRDGDDRSGGRP